MEEEEVKRSVRFPGALYRKIELVAKKQRRSVTAQIVQMLEEAIERQERKQSENEPGNGVLARLEEQPALSA
jgi:hypothetical protein